MSDTTIASGRELTPKNVCYYSTLIAYAVDLIATKCQNINFSNNSASKNYIAPTPSITQLSDQYLLSNSLSIEYEYLSADGGNNKVSNVAPLYGDYARENRIFKSDVYSANPPTLTSVAKDVVTNELTKFLTSVGVLSKSGAVMTTKSILNIFSYIAEFVSTKVIIYKSQDNKTSYTYYRQGRSPSSYVTKLLNDDGTGRLSTSDEYDSIDNMLKAFSNLDNINPNILIVKYSCSSSSSSCSCSCSSCSCSSSSSSSCSSSSSSYIVYMLID